MQTDCQSDKATDPESPKKMNFFQKLFHKLDQKMKDKAETTEPCCCEKESSSDKSSGKCC